MTLTELGAMLLEPVLFGLTILVLIIIGYILDLKEEIKRSKIKIRLLSIDISDAIETLENHASKITELENNWKSLEPISITPVITKKDRADLESKKVAAMKEESDSKYLGLQKNIKRNENLHKFIDSGLIARLGVFYTVKWDENSSSLRIEKYRNDKVAVFYPKSNKINLNGGWINNGSEVLEAELAKKTVNM